MTSQVLLSWLLVHTWQVGILLIPIALFAHLFGKRLPHLTLLLWVVLLIKCVTPPLLESPVGIMAWLTPNIKLTTPLSSEPLVGSEQSTGQKQSAAAPTPGQELLPLSPTPPRQSESSPWSPQFGFAAILTLIWMIGMVVAGTRYLRNYLQTTSAIRQELRNENLPPVDDKTRQFLAEQLVRIGWKPGSVRWIFTNQFNSPFAYGVFKPVCVIPRKCLSQTSTLPTVASHELCHLWRRDPLLGWLQIAAQTILWFHPAVWIASRATDFWCEVCCDDDTMRVFSIQPTTYARVLVAALENQGSDSTTHAMPALNASLVTRQRVESILSRRHSGLFRSTYQASAFFLILCLTPASQSPDWRLGINTQDLPATKTNSTYTATNQDTADKAPFSGPGIEYTLSVENAQREMGFLLGQWHVHWIDSDGKESQIGESLFSVARSGKMIREDWVARDGSTAQGITFFDPSLKQWKMTWVDSAGTIAESSGNWRNGALSLTGKSTDRSGNQFPFTTVLQPKLDNEFEIVTHAIIDQKRRKVAHTIYRKR